MHSSRTRSCAGWATGERRKWESTRTRSRGPRWEKNDPRPHRSRGGDTAQPRIAYVRIKRALLRVAGVPGGLAVGLAEGFLDLADALLDLALDLLTGVA